MVKTVDEPKFQHGVPWRPGFPSSCRLRIFQGLSATVVVMSETGDGMSVTNAAEQIATTAVERYHLNPDQTVFIEHYPTSQTGDDKDTYDKVVFEATPKKCPCPTVGDPPTGMILISPEWSPLTEEKANELCGGELL